MNILVTGGAGYVGRRLVPELKRRGHTVSVVDICLFGNPIEFGVYKCDVNDIPAPMLTNSDAVIHLAGISNDPMAYFSPALNFEYNAAKTVSLAYRARELGVRRFVLASSASIYQGIVSREYAWPDCEVAPKEPYAISKRMAEIGCLGLAGDNFTVVALRKGTIGGWSPRMRYDLVVNTMYKSAVTSGKVTVFVDKNGNSVMRPILDIQDAVNEYCDALSYYTGIYNAFSENISVAEIAHEVAEITDAKIIRETATDSSLIRNYVMGGWLAQRRTVCDTVKELIEKAPADFDNPLYYNIEVWKKWIMSPYWEHTAS